MAGLILLLVSLAGDGFLCREQHAKSIGVIQHEELPAGTESVRPDENTSCEWSFRRDSWRDTFRHV